jgi:hypothetical protein
MLPNVRYSGQLLLVGYTPPVTSIRLTPPGIFASSKSCRIGVFLGGFLIVGITFAPILRIAAWHVIHGNSVLYKGRRIDVPLRWIASSEPQGATLTRLAPTVFSSDKPVHSFIMFSKVGKPPNQTPQQLADSFVAAYWTYLAGNRVVKGPLKVTADSEEIICMEAAPPKDAAHLEVACLFPTGGLTATLLGEREDRDLFYDTVRRVH